MNVVDTIEKTFLPLCRSVADRLSKTYPQYKFSVWSSPIGSSTKYQGHNLGVECVFSDAKEFQADNIGIIIGVFHLTTKPMICEAEVGWGAGLSPDICIELIDEAIDVTTEAILDIESRFDELEACFGNAVSSWEEWAKKGGEEMMHAGIVREPKLSFLQKISDWKLIACLLSFVLSLIVYGVHHKPEFDLPDHHITLTQLLICHWAGYSFWFTSYCFVKNFLNKNSIVTRFFSGGIKVLLFLQTFLLIANAILYAVGNDL